MECGPVIDADGSRGEEDPIERDADRLFAEASSAHSDGRLDEAEMLYRRFLAILPTDAQATHLLASVVAARGEAEESESLFRRAIELDGEDASAWASWGLMAFSRGDRDAALVRFARAFELDPATPMVFEQLASLLAERGDWQRLEAVLFRVVGDPSRPEAELVPLERLLHALPASLIVGTCRLRSRVAPEEVWWRIGLSIALRRDGDAAAAVEVLREAVRIAPLDRRAFELLVGTLIAAGDDAGAFDEVARRPGSLSGSSIARIFDDSGRSLELWIGLSRRLPEQPVPWLRRAWLELARGLRPEAEASLERLLQLDPANTVAMNNLAMLRSMSGDEGGAQALLERAVAVDPEFVEARVNLGHRLHQQGQWARAFGILGGDRVPRSDDLRLRLASAICRLKIAWDNEEELQDGRDAYLEDLASIEEDLVRDRVRTPAVDLAEPLSLTPFYVAYLGLDDMAPQAAFGRIMDRLVKGWLGSAAQAPSLESPVGEQRIRVGILSSHFHEHSVWKVITRGWLEGLDPERFELLGYCTDHVRDHVTAMATSRFSRFRSGAASSREWVEIIRRDRPHVMMIPEIGMEAKAVLLAATSLAPIQATSWGHSITSGLPSVGWFLGADLMEPEDAQRHYTERLLRLPNLSVCLHPADVRPQGRTRRELGFGDEEIVYWCCQSVFKYLPRHDRLFAEIARAVPNATFVFLESRRHPGAVRTFRSRLDRAFASAGIDAGRHCRFLPQHLTGPHDVFGDCCRHADVFLDCPDWSGCNTTLESMTFGMPPVTLPGTTMRTRQTTAILRRMGLEDTIATCQESFVAIAARLGLDHDFRQEVRRSVLERRPRLYGDGTPIRALERWIEMVVRSQR
jgi:predicted O-linked N-acetylglucosamine transferase (SPINDLY family)